MSKPKLVVDACIASASGREGSDSETGSRCRDFLKAIRKANLMIVMNPTLAREWRDHRSTFAMQWETAMMSFRKILLIADREREDLREKISQHSNDEGTVQAMLKDAHLLEAALDADRCVASTDKIVHHFHELSRRFPAIADIMWTDPVDEHGGAIKWVKKELPEQPSRQLSNRRWKRR